MLIDTKYYREYDAIYVASYAKAGMKQGLLNQVATRYPTVKAYWKGVSTYGSIMKIYTKREKEIDFNFFIMLHGRWSVCSKLRVRDAYLLVREHLLSKNYTNALIPVFHTGHHSKSAYPESKAMQEEILVDIPNKTLIGSPCPSDSNGLLFRIEHSIPVEYIN